MIKTDKRKLNFVDSVFILLFVVAGDLIVQLVGTFILSFFDNIIFVNYIIMLLMQLCFALVVWVYTRKKGVFIPVFPLQREGRGVKKAVIDGFVGVGVALIALLFFCQIAGLFDELLSFMGYDTTSSSFEAPDGVSAAFLIIVTCIFAPVVEELVFRGVLLGGLRQVLGKWQSVLLTGLAFSLFHMSPMQTVYQFFLGCSLALVAYDSRSLVPSIAAHFTNNLIAVFTVLFPTFNNLYADYIDIFLIGPAVAAVVPLTALGVFGVWFLSRFVKVPRNEEEESRERARKELKEEKKQKRASGEKPETTQAEFSEEERMIKRQRTFGFAIFYTVLGVCGFIWLINLLMGIVIK